MKLSSPCKLPLLCLKSFVRRTHLGTVYETSSVVVGLIFQNGPSSVELL